MPLDTQYEDQRRYTAPPDPIGYHQTEIDPNDDRHDPDGLDEDGCWDFAQTMNIEPHPSDQ